MKIKSIATSALLMGMFCSTSFAGNMVGTVTGLKNAAASTSKVIYIKVAPALNGDNGAACATHITWDFAFDVTTNLGNSILSMALVSYSTGKPVQVNGTGVCDLHGQVETLDSIILQ